MWTTIYLAMGLERATRVAERLEAEGFMVKKQFLWAEGDTEVYGILTPEFEADEVQVVLFDLDIV
ncbi:MAG: hypothetical protein GX329_01165 [Tissierellia bacterium]|nr:hypothetical protein [Tissierellia bacterium]